jgi:hypothetical protein
VAAARAGYVDKGYIIRLCMPSKQALTPFLMRFIASITPHDEYYGHCIVCGGTSECCFCVHTRSHLLTLIAFREIIEVLKAQGYTRVLDMTGEEANKKYFEGTGRD